jgi:hypothetical protein
MATILSVSEFVQEIENQIKEGTFNYEGSLEEYLRALYSLVQEHRHSEVTWGLLAQLLIDANFHEPPPFDERWLNYTSPPDLSIRETAQVQDDYGYLEHMLLYQISDFYQMNILGVLDSPEIYFGVTSSNGYSWYNFHPETFWGCALGGLNRNSTSLRCNWADLAILLWLGQIYE